MGYWPYVGLGGGIGAVASTVGSIRRTIAKQEVQDLPPVDIDHPDRSTGRT